VVILAQNSCNAVVKGLRRSDTSKCRYWCWHRSNTTDAVNRRISAISRGLSANCLRWFTVFLWTFR